MSTVAIYALLLVAILAETFATTCLTASKQFTRLLPTLGAVFGYVLSFYTFSHVLRGMPVGIAYAIWCALGIILISLAGIVFFHQHLDAAAWLGLALIIAGVVVINVFSGSARH